MVSFHRKLDLFRQIALNDNNSRQNPFVKAVNQTLFTPGMHLLNILYILNDLCSPTLFT